MSYTLELEGFPTLGIGEHINTPDIADLLRSPTIFSMMADDVYEYGGEINKWLLDRTPVTGTKKYVYVSAKLQYLTPTKSPIPNTSWHCDPGVIAPFKADAITHIMACGSKQITSLTEFFNQQVQFATTEDVLNMDHKELREFLDREVPKLGVTPVAIPTERFVTFNCRHAHRAVFPTQNEFRFFYRVVETDMEPKSYDVNKTIMKNGSKIWTIDNDGGIRENPSIEKGNNTIIIHDKD